MGLAKDISSTFYNLKKYVNQLTKHAINYKIIFFENNSKDDTFKLLNMWANTDSNLKLLDNNINTDITNLKREQKLAAYRNILINEIRQEKYSIYTNVIMIDTDFYDYSLTIEPLLKIIKENKFRIITGNTLTNNGVKLVYRDTYALDNNLKPVYFFDGQHNLYFSKLNNLILNNENKNKLKWNNAFGGIGIYKREVFLENSYDINYLYCEHKSLCSEKVLIDPSLIIFKTRFIKIMFYIYKLKHNLYNFFAKLA